MSKSVIEYLKNSVNKYPDKVALVDNWGRVTYKELDNMAKRIGCSLSALIKHGDTVMVYMEKSADTLAACLGVVYAGGTYMPVDVSVPIKRVNDIIRKLKVSYLICDTDYKGIEANSLKLREILENDIDEAVLGKIAKKQKASDILYITATSGSTGEPKCVAVSHKAVISFIEEFVKVTEMKSDDVIGNQAPFDFDISVKDIYSCLKLGATLILIPRQCFSVPTQLLDTLEKSGVTVIIWAVSAMNLLCTFKALEYKQIKSLKKIIFSGEIMPQKTFETWKQYYSQADFYNMYGPSEITCNCTYYKVPKEFKESIIPIGKSFSHCKVFLADERDNLIEKSMVKGELYVAGESLSAGYAGDEKRTREVFLNKPFCAEKVYKTGDLAYYNNDGDLIFSGRVDRQIKHMGYRIELQDIENSMQSLTGVLKAAVIERNGRLLAFYIGNYDERQVRQELSEILPEYMMPRLKKVDNLPVNKNGKVDYEALYE